MDALMLPSNWQRVRLGDIAEIKRGVRITKNELDVFGKYPVVSGGVGFLGYTNNFNRYENTITIAQYGTAGYVNFQKNKFWANDVCFCVYPNKNIIKNIFLYYFLKVNQNYLYEISNRNATPYSISKDKILDFEIPLPPLNEQIAIANVLSDVDRYLYSLDALILKKESVKKALSFELLSQRKRLKGFNQNWQRVRLGDICEITTGSLDANEMVHYGKYRFYTCAKEYYFIDKYAFDTEAILISGNGAYVGYVHYYKGKFNAYQRTYVLDNFSEHIIFVKYFLTMFLQSHIQTNRNEGNTPYIVMATLKDFEIPLPPLNEQIAIANILSDLDNEIISLKNKKRQFENIKKALNHDLMSAKIRVLKE
ncbi:restriction endonuclease subunit S [Helicobacter pylori]|uniref:restriction endonuclease subunit S n=1 Tax=Helicobacter pylori TaxID=210 RepID=UPI000EABD286|nr:restriction endonuclease subunit S [Helicobacter pylori]RKV10376.1 restriction endonuclease subunit S [Helicobacter pylori]WQX59207.1 restriction endonuclease subunit S [Helicobacter pylori]